MTTPKRGEVYLVNFDPTTGAEIRKTRPALVLQNDIANRHSPITIVAAMSSKVDPDFGLACIDSRASPLGSAAKVTLYRPSRVSFGSRS